MHKTDAPPQWIRVVAVGRAADSGSAWIKGCGPLAVQPAGYGHRLELARHPLGGDPGIGDGRQAFLRHVADHVENAQAPF